jgi:hypothetical protein
VQEFFMFVCTAVTIHLIIYECIVGEEATEEFEDAREHSFTPTHDDSEPYPPGFVPNIAAHRNPPESPINDGVRDEHAPQRAQEATAGEQGENEHENEPHVLAPAAGPPNDTIRGMSNDLEKLFAAKLEEIQATIKTSLETFEAKFISNLVQNYAIIEHRITSVGRTLTESVEEVKKGLQELKEAASKEG